eukprot:65643-Pyramimonas_sp.AAC.1
MFPWTELLALVTRIARRWYVLDVGTPAVDVGHDIVDFALVDTEDLACRMVNVECEGRVVHVRAGDQGPDVLVVGPVNLAFVAVDDGFGANPILGALAE